jgi:hypothetical protein
MEVITASPSTREVHEQEGDACWQNPSTTRTRSAMPRARLTGSSKRTGVLSRWPELEKPSTSQEQLSQTQSLYAQVAAEAALVGGQDGVCMGGGVTAGGAGNDAHLASQPMALKVR